MEENKALSLQEFLDKNINDKELSKIIENMGFLATLIDESIQSQPDVQSQQETLQGYEKLDEKVNKQIISYFEEVTKSVAAITTMKSPHLKEINEKANYIIGLDTLDGISNIEANISLGTIFGIYNVIKGKKYKSSFKSANNLVMSGYILYSNAIYLCIALDKVNIFAYDEDLEKFILIKENHKIPEQGDTYSINECYTSNWYPVIEEYIEELKGENSYDIRYSGTLVADFHRILMSGGVYCYPTDKKQKTGKLKLVYECQPLAHIVEKAGGQAISNIIHQPKILEQKVDDINARSGLIIGSEFEINLFMEMASKQEEETTDNSQHTKSINK